MVVLINPCQAVLLCWLASCCHWHPRQCGDASFACAALIPFLTFRSVINSRGFNFPPAVTFLFLNTYFVLETPAAAADDDAASLPRKHNVRVPTPAVFCEILSSKRTSRICTGQRASIGPHMADGLSHTRTHTRTHADTMTQPREPICTVKIHKPLTRNLLRKDVVPQSSLRCDVIYLPCTST